MSELRLLFDKPSSDYTLRLRALNNSPEPR